jgi:hypothetical protein
MRGLLADTNTGIQAGLGKPLTSVPLFLLTARELNIKGDNIFCHLS